jgi:hypothetical protein
MSARRPVYSVAAYETQARDNSRSTLRRLFPARFSAAWSAITLSSPAATRSRSRSAATICRVGGSFIGYERDAATAQRVDRLGVMCGPALFCWGQELR